MEITLSPDQEVRFAGLAAREGRETRELGQEAVVRLLEEARFAEAVKLGLAAADRSEFVASDEVWARVGRIVRR
jgi:predicted transcriptional regulator